MGRLRKPDAFAGAVARSRGRARLAAAVAAASLLSLIAVQPALAGQIVWNKGNAAIWAMNDDGSNQRQLTGVPPGMSPDGVRAPGTVPNSATVLFSARTAQYATIDSGGIERCGNNCEGIYKLENATVTRLSDPPSACSDCSSFQFVPAGTGDGRYVFWSTESHYCSSTTTCSNHTDGTGSFLFSPLAGGGSQTFGNTACGGNYSHDPAPNPAKPGELAYAGCYALDSDPSYSGDPTDRAIIASGPNRQGERNIDIDDELQKEPSWSADGTQLIDVEGGADAGLVVTDVDTPTWRVALQYPGSGEFHVPRFAGNRIVFAYKDASGSSDIWSIPADCVNCTLSGNATRLTSGGNNTDPAWTSAATIPSAGTPGGGGGSTGGGGAGAGGGIPGGGGPVITADTTAPTLGLTISRQKLGAVLSKGLKISETVPEASTVVDELDLDPAQAKSLHLTRKAVVIGRATTSFAGPGKKDVVIKLSRKAKAKLRHVKVAKLILKATATDPARNSATTSRKVKLRR